ncbi:chalcone isomerase family protein [Methylophaga pinxianii]|uniref:chalcone isomerase family protein n=1 Tax=Methylophaga pinxianii TaxID=2881052 RepID=UPI001CF54437|nr:chalcone isomerase family protein [Methylophaga pinxianii]MCB2426179.1 chalcone isomerase family protein [Methylophaga pinxianii]UPH45049.1 chalcone isomerase family protein [Methylophaga pinxianii]
MKKRYFVILLSVFQSVHANSFESEIRLNDHTLKQCSAVPIKVMLFNLGDVALYREQCNDNTELTSKPLQLSFIYKRSFDAEDFQKSSVELLKRNLDANTFASIESALLEFNAGYQQADEGDRYDIRFSAATGLVLFKNGIQLSQSDNAQLGKTYFDIWFGQDPFSKGMKNDLLAGLKQ